MRTFLSIGTGPGIGIATAKRFAAEGFHIVVSSRTPTRLATFVKSLQDEGGSCEATIVDASITESVSALINGTLDRHGSIEVLHYNAASLRRSKISEQPRDSFSNDLSVNVAGAMVAIQAVSASMLARRQGTILLTGGRFGLNPSPDYISLSVGKAGIRALALGLFQPFMDNGVHIAIANVAGPVDPESSVPAGVAECFWRLHDTPKEHWVPEAAYP